MKWHSPVLIPFLTLACNFQCKYCITKFSPDHDFSFNQLDQTDWLDFLHSTQGVSDIIFNGGEPTLFPHFPDLINALQPLNLLAIGTNYSPMATAALLKLTPRADLILDGTFHPDFITYREISSNLYKLKAAGFRIRIHALNYPPLRSQLSAWIHGFRSHDIDAFIQEYEGFHEGILLPKPSKLPACSLKETTRVKCSRSIYTPIAPDGTIYFCHYLMYSQDPRGRLGQISDTQVEFPDFLDCPHYGWCSPCDWPRQIWPHDPDPS